MQVLRGILIVAIIAIYGYTGVVVTREGLDFLNPFLENIFAVTWSGQFNLDFLFYLVMSALWVAWRHGFSRNGLVLAALCGFGFVYFAPYVLVQSLRANSVHELVLGVQSTG